MKQKQVLQKLKEGWMLENFDGLSPHWQITNQKNLMESDTVYYQTAHKLIKLENVKEFKHFPVVTYVWVEKK